MKYNQLGHSDIRVSELGVGCQSLGGGLFHSDRKGSIAMIHRAMDEGVNFFDTSDHYSRGLSEQWLAAAVKGRRQDVVLATKVGTHYTRIGNLASSVRPLLRPLSDSLRPLKVSFHRARATQKRQDFSADYLIRAVDASLKRLDTSYIDLLQLHKPPVDELHWEECIETLEKLKDQGKIRSYGISCATTRDALLCLDRPGISSIQVGISLLDQEAIPTLLQKLEDQHISVIVRNPRAQGHLTAALSDIMAETYARNNQEVAEKARRAHQYSFLVNEKRTLAQAALQFVLQLPNVTTAIPRAVNVTQLLENLGALDSPRLNAGEIEKIMNDKHKARPGPSETGKSAGGL